MEPPPTGTAARSPWPGPRSTSTAPGPAEETKPGRRLPGCRGPTTATAMVVGGERRPVRRLRQGRLRLVPRDDRRSAGPGDPRRGAGAAGPERAGLGPLPRLVTGVGAAGRRAAAARPGPLGRPLAGRPVPVRDRSTHGVDGVRLPGRGRSYRGPVRGGPARRPGRYSHPRRPAL